MPARRDIKHKPESSTPDFSEHIRERSVYAQSLFPEAILFAKRASAPFFAHKGVDQQAAPPLSSPGRCRRLLDVIWSGEITGGSDEDSSRFDIAAVASCRGRAQAAEATNTSSAQAKGGAVCIKSIDRPPSTFGFFGGKKS